LTEITIPCLTWADSCALPDGSSSDDTDCKFDGGAFVGGMFSIIGSIVVGGVGYYVWMKYFKGKKEPFKVNAATYGASDYNEL